MIEKSFSTILRKKKSGRNKNDWKIIENIDYKILYFIVCIKNVNKNFTKKRTKNHCKFTQK